MDAQGPKERLLKTAVNLFYKQGYQATGINQLLKESGVAKASFYDHFEDKEDLYIAFLRQRHENWAKALDSYVTKKRTAPAKIKAIFKYIEDWMIKDSYRGCAFVNSAAEFTNPKSKVRKVVNQAKDSLRSYIKELLLSHIKETKIKPDQIDKLCDELYILIDGAIVASQIYRDVWPARRAATSAEKLLFN